MLAVHDHVAARIHKATLETEPFTYGYIQNIFPTDFYAELIAKLPPSGKYAPSAPPYESRTSLDINSATTRDLGAFWQSFEEWINGQALLDCMVEKFKPVLPTMSALRSEQLAAHTLGDAVRISCRTLLVRDSGDFTLGPHTDSANKFVTAIFYLSKDNRFVEFGTSVYKPKETGFTSWLSKHWPHDKFDLVSTMPNVPNSVFIFAKTDRSFHGVQPGAYSNDGRDLLMWAPHIDPAKHPWGELSVPRSLFEWSPARVPA